MVALWSLQQWRVQRVRFELRKREELFRLVTENAADMIALVDVDGRRLYNSPSYQKVLGYSPEELRESMAFQQIHPDDQPKVKQAAQSARITGTGKTLEYRIRHKNGSWRTLESTASAIRNAEGHIDKLVIVNRDITDRKSIETRLEYNALHDSLTNLPNRAMFMDRLAHAADQAKRHRGWQFAVLLVNIDGFKALNDSFGHKLGSKLIIDFGRRLADCLRRSDTISRSIFNDNGASEDFLARLGVDDFTILVESITCPNDAVLVARRIKESLAVPFSIGEHKLFLSASIGIALSSSLRKTEDLVRDAHIAMVRARSQSRGRWQFFDPEMHEIVANRVQVEMDLKRAIDQQEFRLYYQPIVNLETGFLAGFEALLRWQPQDLDLVNPHRFIDVAEETGLIVPIGQWVVKEACQQLKRWQGKYHDLTITVNVSPKQFLHADFVQGIEDVLAETNLPTNLLHLEITESMAMTDSSRAERILNQLRDLGVRLSIDDFGTGHSSLSRLSRLPVDVLKIDQSFVAGMESHEDKVEIVRLIVTLAHTFKLRIIAEGAENAEQVARLANLGCEFVQGYFFSKPVDLNRANVLLQDHYANAPFAVKKNPLLAFSKAAAK